ncbi:DUF6372 family protein [Nocardia salmonicida]|uniref:DUF6372 family protein n=1 Tax=Nocardia salmonicida TaxID=53431 RepID=UPI0007A410D6|nr:DUF6372 family protein [Nocardia salmonicida]
MSAYHVLTVRIPTLMLWTQHAGGCRCLCGIYHSHRGRGGCDQRAHEGLFIRLEVADGTGLEVADEDQLLPVCRRCYLAMDPTTSSRRAAVAPACPRTRVEQASARP